MCGITGFYGPATYGEDALGIIERMSMKLAHRGPDDAGHWLDPDAGIVLGHRRLSIIDLSAAGHQPMMSCSGRYVIVYNGEIYNFGELRSALDEAGASPDWRGHSDTEVLLAAIDHWGVEDTLVRINGMFAFALWDRRERQLYLARDRLGEKPIYYGRSGNFFLFGSELKALTVFPGFQAEVDRDALAQYLFLRHKYIPTPWSIWKGIRKLPPAHYMVVRDSGQHVGELKCYWDFTTIAEEGARDPLKDDPGIEDRLDAALREAVAGRMKADVPLGALLSGGVDSSTIVALMQDQTDKPVRTFSIGFDEKSHNEAHHARSVAAHLGTDHTELYVSPEHALEVVPNLPSYWDEPFADSSQIPTYLVCEMTRRYVTVSLSGDGGDELFGGYKRYLQAVRLYRYLDLMPAGMRRSLADMLDRKIHAPSPMNSWIRKISQLCRAGSHRERYRNLITQWKFPANVVLNASAPGSNITWFNHFNPDFPDLRQYMMYVDTQTYLPDDILVKLDRASMAVSLEARVPFLDHRLVEFICRLPVESKINHGKGKHILKKILHRYVPQSIVDRPKMGFRTPVAGWLRGPFRDWAEELLNEHRLRQEGYFDSTQVRRLWDLHLQGSNHWQSHLWAILMFQAWWEKQNQSTT